MRSKLMLAEVAMTLAAVALIGFLVFSGGRYHPHLATPSASPARTTAPYLY